MVSPLGRSAGTVPSPWVLVTDARRPPRAGGEVPKGREHICLLGPRAQAVRTYRMFDRTDGQMDLLDQQTENYVEGRPRGSWFDR